MGMTASVNLKRQPTQEVIWNCWKGSMRLILMMVIALMILRMGLKMQGRTTPPTTRKEVLLDQLMEERREGSTWMTTAKTGRIQTQIRNPIQRKKRKRKNQADLLLRLALCLL